MRKLLHILGFPIAWVVVVYIAYHAIWSFQDQPGYGISGPLGLELGTWLFGLFPFVWPVWIWLAITGCLPGLERFDGGSLACSKCGYALSGLPANAACPECGSKSVDPETREPEGSAPPQPN